MDANGNNVEATGDAETRNVFAERIRKILRTGADSNISNQIIMQTATKRDANGQIVYKRNPDGSIMRDSTGKPVKDTIQLNLLDIAERVEQHKEITKEEAWALSEIVPKMNQIGGNIRVQAVATQTSEPNSGGK